MSSMPKKYKRLMVHKLTTDFSEAVVIETVDMCHPTKGEVCIKNKYVGVNASDVIMSKGRYMVSGEVPFGVGMEGVGEIVEVGEGVDNLTVGQCVAYMNSQVNSYAEFVCMSSKEVLPVPDARPEFLVLFVSGLTAAISLDQAACIKPGETVLITAAAGGTGHLAVQWAKAAGCHVIGTCSTTEKMQLLRRLGCDRVINYKRKDFDEVLNEEYKDGINVVWESIGGKTFKTVFKHLSRRGRLIIVGGTSGYKNEGEDGIPKDDFSTLPRDLIKKSVTLQGFLLSDYKEYFSSYFLKILEKIQNGEIKPVIDNGVKTTAGGNEFSGMEGIISAVEHLHSGKNVGKVVARVL